MARLELTGLYDDDAAPGVRVVLSRRNLLALLHKLDVPGSARKIGGGYIYLEGQLVPFGSVGFEVCCEDDDSHYIGREPPGEMHPDTEEFIKEKTDGGG